MSNLLIGVLASIIATFIISLFVWLYRGSKGYLGIRKTIRLINDCNKSGIINIFPSRKSYIERKDHGTASTYISQSKFSLYYIGFWLASSTEIGAILNEIKKLIFDSKKVFIVFIDPGASLLINQSSIYLGLSSDEIKIRVENSLNKLLMLKENIQEEYKNNLVIKLHRVPLSASAFIIDSEQEKDCKILIDYKIYGSSRDDSYGIEYKGRNKIIASKMISSYINICDNARELTKLVNKQTRKK